MAEGTDRLLGDAFPHWSVTPDAVEGTLQYRPAAVMRSFGDPRPLAEPALAAGVRPIVQVTDLDDAARGVEFAPT